MGYRDECLERIAIARSRIDEALNDRSPATSALDTWRAVWDELQREQPPAADQAWLADRLDDLRIHVQNSPRWRELL